MSLQHAAQHLEKQGRNGDTTLVHMSKGEVKSLNDLAMAHGGHLTINPQTGLPEAGFLRAILPMVAGAALTGLTGGVINPMTAGLLVGGGTAVATGSLQKGLMAGLGAYGGAGIGSALAASGTQVAGTTAAGTGTAAAGTAGTGTAAAVPPAPVVNNPLGGINYAPPSAVSQPAFSAIDPNPAVQLGTGSPMPGVNIKPTPVNAPLSQVDQVVRPNTTASNLRNIGNQASANLQDFSGKAIKGIESLGTEGGPTRFYENLGNVSGTFGPKTTLAAAAAPAFSEYMESQKDKNKPTPSDSDPGQQYTYAANPTNPTPIPDPYGREQRYFSPAYTARAAAGGMMASGGISHLGDYSDGGRLLRGPGDGVSDSIPAVIGRKQPARLADGEFVVPARIVSELGNGSTEAGARKLYAMMDRIQKARKKTVGKGKVAKNSRSEKYLPA